MTREQRQRAATAIRQASKIVLACHVNPDGDALGSLCALGLAIEADGRQVVMLSPDGVPDHCAFIPGTDRVLRTPPTRDFDLGIGLDADGSDRLGSAEPVVLGAPLVIDIDHHVGAERYGQIRVVDPSASATGELVYELIRDMGAPITPEIATALMAAIVTDTGGFRYANVTPRTLEIAAALIGHGVHPTPIIERVYGRRTFAATRLLGTALANVQLAVGGRLAWAALDRAAFAQAGARDEETDGIVSELRAIDGVGVAILLREAAGGEVRVSLRSRDGTDVAAIASRFGGGGHRAAAGCTLPGPLPAAVESVLLAAQDLMTRTRKRERAKTRKYSRSLIRKVTDELKFQFRVFALSRFRVLSPDHLPRSVCMTGVLNLYKPAGPTSHDVVAQVRRRVGIRRVGHAGTLDPMARGVLVLCLGAATRIIEYWSQMPKRYVAEMVLGVATDTQDTTGQVIEEHPAGHIRAEELRAALEPFRGAIQQVPPMVSAVKHEGERLYRLARAGQEVERRPRPVTIYAIECLAFEPGERPRARLAVTCSGGTYVRTLCADIGAALGTGGAMSDLERTAVGPFRVEESLSLVDLAALTAAGRLSERLISPADALAHLPSVVLDEEACQAIFKGQAVSPPQGGDLSGPIRLLDPHGDLVAIARLQEQDGEARLAPEKVFGSPA